MVKVNQIRAARGLLGWHQKDLARAAGISELSVINIENEKTSPQKSTLDKIVQAFELAGVGFTADGVEERMNNLTVFKEEKWYLKMMKDVEITFDTTPDADKEWGLIYPDERLSPPVVTEKIKYLRAKGIRRRLFIEEGNTFIPSPLRENRCIPKKHFDRERLIHYYADKIAICDQSTKVMPDEGKGTVVKRVKEEAQVYIFRNAELANFIRGLANLMWDVLPQPAKSTAKKHESYE